MRATSRAACAAAMAALCAVAPLASRAQQAVSAVAAASSAATAPMTLLEAYRLALAQDATIRAARAQADSRRERIPQARSQLLPNLSASYGRNRNDLNSTTPGLTGPVQSEQFYDSSNKVIQLRQPLFRPYQMADLAQARAQVAEANAQLDKETQNLAVRVAGAYLDVLLAQDQVALVEQQKATYTANLDAATKRFKAGAGVRTDIDDARAKLDLTLAQELEARQNLDYKKRALQVIVNVPVTRLAPLDPARLKLTPPMLPSLEDWLQRAEEAAPEIQALVAQRDAARREIDKQRAGHLPTVDLIAQRSVSDSDNVTRINSRYDSKSIGVQVNIPIFAGGQVNSLTRQAIADLERAEQALEATRRDLGLRIEVEYRGITEGIPKVKALEQAAKSAEIMVTSNRRSFEGGARTLLDILSAEDQRMSALRDLAQARYMYLMSRVRLQALVGGADDSLILEINTALAP